MTHSIHKEGDLQIYFCLIFRETRHHTQAHVTSGALIHWPREEHRFRRPVFVMVTLESQNIFLHPHLVFQPIWGWGNLSSFQLPQSNSSPEGA